MCWVFFMQSSLSLRPGTWQIVRRRETESANLRFLATKSKDWRPPPSLIELLIRRNSGVSLHFLENCYAVQPLFSWHTLRSLFFTKHGGGGGCQCFHKKFIQFICSFDRAFLKRKILSEIIRKPLSLKPKIALFATTCLTISIPCIENSGKQKEREAVENIDLSVLHTRPIFLKFSSRSAPPPPAPV